MGKRFGRNKKRAMRAEIAALTAENNSLVRAVKAEERVAAEARQELFDVIDCLRRAVRGFAGLNPENIDGVGRRDSFALAFQARSVQTRAWDPDVPFDPSAFVADNFHVDMHALRVLVESNFEPLAHVVHCRYWGGGQSSYMVSGNAMKFLSEQEIAKHIVPDIAEALIRDIKGQL